MLAVVPLRSWDGRGGAETNSIADSGMLSPFRRFGLQSNCRLRCRIICRFCDGFDAFLLWNGRHRKFGRNLVRLLGWVGFRGNRDVIGHDYVVSWRGG